ncbi:MAG: energy transducer TonB [Bacteroidales bacterium]|nr:energy transducer TonB [Candidatus Equimonas enterica]
MHKGYLITVCLLLLPLAMVAQREVEDSVPVTDTRLFDGVAETFPEYPGGETALLQYLRDNIRYPKEAYDNGIEGRVIVSFLVVKDGSVQQITVMRSPDESLSREAVRVVSGMPHWKPGTRNGKPVDVRYTLPVTFAIQ